jgi:hypothetical protein
MSSAMIHFTRHCNEEGLPTLANSILSGLLKCNLQSGPGDWMESPMVTYEWIKLGWESEAASGAPSLARLVTFTSTLTTQRSKGKPGHADELDDHLLARSLRRLGVWTYELEAKTLTRDVVEEVLELHEKVIACDETWDRAWLWWALANCRMLDDKVHAKLPPLSEVELVVSALKGFFKAIACGSGQSLEHGLRLIRLWFR